MMSLELEIDGCGWKQRKSHTGATTFKLPAAHFMSEIPSRIEHNTNIKKFGIDL